MSKLIIFDFNRTLFDPEKQKLVSGARTVLKILQQLGHRLCLVAQASPSREELIWNLGIRNYFSEILLVTEKKKKIFQQLISSQGFTPNETVVIGDRTKKEILVGSSLGCETIWIKSGKFKMESPDPEAVPTHTIVKLVDVLKIIH